jgi:methylmalonyl-CoA mutase N-terminal domain/subunit
MYAKILRDRFGAKDPRSMVIRQRTTAQIGAVSTTLQRPLNNLTRSVIGAMAAALSGGVPFAFPPYDEPMGLGWSMEARQLSEDAARILTCEAKIMDVVDPFAGSYCMEALTKEVEDEAWEEYEKIQAMGGAVAAIEQGYMQREVAKSAYEFERKLQTGEELKVGVNCFTGEHELEVETTRLVAHPYDPERREKAEETQIAHLAEVKRSRSEKDVRRLLKELDQKTREQDGVLMPTLIECAKAYVTLQEVCDVFREVFGEYEAPSIL